MLKIKSNTNEFTIIFSEKIGKKKNAQKISFSLCSVQHPFFFSPSFLLFFFSASAPFSSFSVQRFSPFLFCFPAPPFPSFCFSGSASLSFSFQFKCCPFFQPKNIFFSPKPFSVQPKTFFFFFSSEHFCFSPKPFSVQPKTFFSVQRHTFFFSFFFFPFSASFLFPFSTSSFSFL